MIYSLPILSTTSHPCHLNILGGDVNNLDCGKICDTFPDLVNIVASPTRGNRVLDVLITNLHQGYDKAVIRPPIQPDQICYWAAGDHSVAGAQPNTDKANRTGFSRKVVRTRRAVLKSSLALLGFFLATYNWSGLHCLKGADAKLFYLNEVLFSAQDCFCPLEHISIRIDKHPFASAKLAKLAKLKSKEFRKHRYSFRFKELKKECKEELRNIKQRRIQEAVDAGDGNNSWLGCLDQLLDPDGKSTIHGGVLPEDLAAGLSRQQQAEDYASHISKISREYIPLSRAVLPDRVTHALENGVCKGHPNVEDHDVYEILRGRKLTGGVAGDMDPRVVKACMVELVHPVACVYREAVVTHEWPTLWKIEKQVMLKKCPNPQTKDDMRNLGLSPYFNKGLEQVLVSWLLQNVSRFLSRDQFGGKKSCSGNHYLRR